MHGECTYCKYDPPHLPTTLSDWSSKDWDSKKANAGEQCPLLDFNLLEKQLQETLQDLIQDKSQDTLDNNMVEKNLTKGFQALTLKEDTDRQNLGCSGDKPEVLGDDNKVEENENETSMPAYKMTKQELQLQEEEEKYRVFMGNIQL